MLPLKIKCLDLSRTACAALSSSDVYCIVRNRFFENLAKPMRDVLQRSYFCDFLSTVLKFAKNKWVKYI